MVMSILLIFKIFSVTLKLAVHNLFCSFSVVLLASNYSNTETSPVEFVAINYFYVVILKFLLLLSGDIESNPGPENATLSIFHQNIRSIRNKFEYIKDNFLDYDILCFTETKLSFDINNDMLKLEGYDTIYRKDNTAFSGGLLVLCVVKFSFEKSNYVRKYTSRIHLV